MIKKSIRYFKNHGLRKKLVRSFFEPNRRAYDNGEPGGDGGNMLKLDVGCGQNKKKGFLGIDIIPADGVDYVLDITKEKLPLEDNTANKVFSNHFFEHIDSPKEALEELIRVSVHNASFEIWTPYLKSNEAFVLGHKHFYNETIWRHICIEYPHFWLRDVEATLRLDRFCFVLRPGVRAELKKINFPLSFALRHMFNIASELGAFMTVLKGKGVKDKHYSEPEVYVSDAREGPFVKL
jgi:SAM-dependent methyltransferase